MATDYSGVVAAPTPFLDLGRPLNVRPPPRSLSLPKNSSTSTTSATSTTDDYMAAQTSMGTLPPPPPSPSPSAPSFMQEIDVWIDNMSHLVSRLEEQHRRREFGLQPAANKPEGLKATDGPIGPRRMATANQRTK